MDAYTTGMRDALLELDGCSKHCAHECEDEEEERERGHDYWAGGARGARGGERRKGGRKEEGSGQGEQDS